MHGGVPSEELSYAKDQRDSGDVYCFSCVQKLTLDEECCLQNNKILFPLEDAICVGEVKYHVCTSSLAKFLPAIATFERGKISKDLRMF